MMKQSGVSGTVNGIIYRHLLQVQLTTSEFVARTSVIGNVGWGVVRIPLARIRDVKQLRLVWMFGMKVMYVDDVGKERMLKWYTFRYQRWTHAFEAVGIPVRPYRHWFDWFELPPVYSERRKQ